MRVHVRTSEKRWQTNYYSVEVSDDLTPEQAHAEAERQVKDGEVYPYDYSSGESTDEPEEIEDVSIE
jgi:hypothetical protein